MSLRPTRSQLHGLTVDQEAILNMFYSEVYSEVYSKPGIYFQVLRRTISKPPQRHEAQWGEPQLIPLPSRFSTNLTVTVARLKGGGEGRERKEREKVYATLGS